MKHSTNSREGKIKMPHNRKAGHGRALRALGNRAKRRRGKAAFGERMRQQRY